jgi:hypothetical protein
MTLATLLGSVEHPFAAGSFLTRMRAWLATAPMLRKEAEGDERIVNVTAACTAKTQSAVLLPFPIRGEALLVKLADLLRARVAAVAPRPNPFLLTMSRAPRLRLLIDHASYIEFHADRATFHVVLEATPDTTIRLDTTDFDTLVQFVAEYVNGRFLEFQAMEAAS